MSLAKSHVAAELAHPLDVEVGQLVDAGLAVAAPTAGLNQSLVTWRWSRCSSPSRCTSVAGSGMPAGDHLLPVGVGAEHRPRRVLPEVVVAGDGEHVGVAGEHPERARTRASRRASTGSVRRSSATRACQRVHVGPRRSVREQQARGVGASSGVGGHDLLRSIPDVLLRPHAGGGSGRRAGRLGGRAGGGRRARRLGRRRHQGRGARPATRCGGCSRSPAAAATTCRARRSTSTTGASARSCSTSPMPTERARGRCWRLLATADVFLTNLRPDAVDRLGLGAEAVLAANPRLVYASVTGYGRTGPDAAPRRLRRRRLLGPVGHRLAGGARRPAPAALPRRHRRPRHRHDHRRRHPRRAARARAHRPGPPGGDVAAAHRHLVPRLGPEHAAALRQARGRRCRAPSQPNPMINPYRAGDGRWFWLLGVEGDRLWPKLLAGHRARGVGRRRAVRDGTRPPPPRRRARSPCSTSCSPRGHSTSGPRRFDAHDVWWAPVNTPDEVVVDPQAIAAGAFVDVPGGSGSPAAPGGGVAGGVPDRQRRRLCADPAGARRSASTPTRSSPSWASPKEPASCCAVRCRVGRATRRWADCGRR